MHMIDAGPNQCVGPAHVAKYKCGKCGLESEWQTAETMTEVRRGIPCPKCNPSLDVFLAECGDHIKTKVKP